jgi:hypothetical protein
MPTTSYSQLFIRFFEARTSQTFKTFAPDIESKALGKAAYQLLPTIVTKETIYG